MKSPIKWVGGKGKLLGQLAPLLPADYTARRHVELFAGGAALFFGQQPANALLVDINARLIRMYRALRDDPEHVIAQLDALVDVSYADTRRRFNEGARDDAQHAALFIRLNKTCFNGLYRVNRTGAFNVPQGKFKTPPTVYDVQHLRDVASLLKHATLFVAPVEDGVRYVVESDFVYLDPPYAPVSETSNFVGYASDGFTWQDQVDLEQRARMLVARGAKVMLSNSATPFIRTIYSRAPWNLTEITAGRSINSAASKRGAVAEFVIRSYTE